MFHRVASLVVLVVVSGCSSINVMQEKLRIRDEVMSSAKEVFGCTDKLKAVPKYVPLYAKLALDTRIPATQEQLSDISRPTDEEVQLGMEWYEDNQSCTRLGAEKFGRIDPGLGAYMIRAQADTVALFQEVITTRPTLGYVNTKIKLLHEKRMVAAKQWGADLDTRLKRLKEEQDAATAENKRMFMATVGAITETAAAVLVVSVAVLAAQQTALAQAQQQYVLMTPNYRPVRITNTSCNYVGTMLYCNQSSY